MKHEFVLDENILYLGIRGVNEKGDFDTTTTKLLALIVKNCHRILVDRELNRRYAEHLKTLEKISKEAIPGMDMLIRNLLYNSDKISRYFITLDPIPDEDRMPRKDIHVVRAGYHFKAKIVTVDKKLAQAISSSSSMKKEKIIVLRPEEAIELAEET